MGTQLATTPDEGWVFVAKLEDLREKRIVVVTAGRARVAVVADADRVFAVDNRCPHMGFPLDRGSVEDGILTCHWHTPDANNLEFFALAPVLETSPPIPRPLILE